MAHVFWVVQPRCPGPGDPDSGRAGQCGQVGQRASFGFQFKFYQSHLKIAEVELFEHIQYRIGLTEDRSRDRDRGCLKLR